MGLVSFCKLLPVHFKTGSGSRAIALGGQSRVTDCSPPSSVEVFILYARSLQVHGAHVHRVSCVARVRQTYFRSVWRSGRFLPRVTEMVCFSHCKENWSAVRVLDRHGVSNHGKRGSRTQPVVWNYVFSLSSCRRRFWIPGTTSRWQWLLKIVSRYGAVRSVDDSVGSAASVPASIKLFPCIRIVHSAKQCKEPFVPLRHVTVDRWEVYLLGRQLAFVLLILVMPSCHRLFLSLPPHDADSHWSSNDWNVGVSREGGVGGVEEAERPGILSCLLQNLRAVHSLLSWLRSKVVCLSQGNFSLAPCWGSLINRGSPTVRKVIELFIYLRRYDYRPALLSVGDHEPLQYFLWDFPHLLLANDRSLRFTLNTSIALHKSNDVLVKTMLLRHPTRVTYWEAVCVCLCVSECVCVCLPWSQCKG